LLNRVVFNMCTEEFILMYRSILWLLHWQEHWLVPHADALWIVSCVGQYWCILLILSEFDFDDYVLTRNDNLFLSFLFSRTLRALRQWSLMISMELRCLQTLMLQSQSIPQQ
jgi:hypothetical protein